MNCANCGALPVDGACPYCGSGEHVNLAPRAVFDQLMKAVRACTFDSAKESAVSAAADILVRSGQKLTVGQVRRVAREFVFDTGKLAAFRLLLPHIDNPAGLLEAADVFGFDDTREALWAMAAPAPVQVQHPRRVYGCIAVVLILTPWSLLGVLAVYLWQHT